MLAATNKDLTDEIAAGRFREDLYYRLNVIPIHVPPLRQRRGDVPALAQEFLQEMAAKFHQKSKRLTPAALELLTAQDWPGNVRELKNLVERLVILCPAQEIDTPDLESFVAGRPAAGAGEGGLSGLDLAADWRQARADFEKLYLEEQLSRHNGNISATAEAVGLERSQLQQEASRRRMLSDLPNADVVITNPTHLAVAIRYDGAKMDAPVVIAKGARLLAQKIKSVAKEHYIPIMENKPLARALYKSTSVGAAVPGALFAAVAELLAFVYQTQGKLEQKAQQNRERILARGGRIEGDKVII